MSDRWLVSVDQNCIGSGMCAGAAPEHFELMDGYARPIKDEVDPDEAVIDAAESCPVEAILVKLASTGEVVAPKE
ncbi:ferredoxin [Allokutzneria albata]|uniref:Ferredoxin n=1 Tax=Allokutzneria albata TaxID=211114 RepID=A0A1H0C4X2_ALLAB|nr:ferredoxin [Allokutzneria albata]SDN52934.1 ferredoxin [Allokutzneria albata]